MIFAPRARHRNSHTRVFSQVAAAADDLRDMAFSCEVMEDPVVAADGYTYNRKEIMLWFAKHNVRTFRRLEHAPLYCL